MTFGRGRWLGGQSKVTIRSYERGMQALLLPSCYILLPVKSFLNLLFVPPFLVHTVTSDPEPLNLN